MNAKMPQQNTVKAWQVNDLLLELYHYVPGSIEPIPKHSHEDYQIGFSSDSIGEYFYRGTCHHVPMESFSILHTDEPHKSREVTWFDTPCSFWMLYIKPNLFYEVTEQLIGCSTMPFFKHPVITDCDLATKFLQFCGAIEQRVSRLEQESLQLSFLSSLIQRYADVQDSSQLIGKQQHQIKQIREYLEEHLEENVSLEYLAQMVNLSPYYLNRVFRKEVGIPPHKYQIQVRIDHAKALLQQGLSVKQVAEQLGFADVSHFTRHFKQLVQVTPGQYLSQQNLTKEGKNVQK
ncbi:helix-turn-helix transcriptional regulator [Oculatella sp. FACHB-28]|uniref:AraC family transcriptional regulator n=2 Tax=Cyanophyceae TaxID=3028117 RepID=UPI0016890A40|nr:AraC family transcriptional regulator [Oculatella sp. FACHB-28]MBD1998577.1 helix-turn-helix transcriptional regulator [Leptolyngbya sp. FACHB-541]MBD2054454.1 helix-turn-helix transcriptional regulator [Oculatella sp. FACHB-28]